MTINGPVTFLLPEDLARQIGKRLEARRLSQNTSRKTLAAQSGVPVSTIRHFETSGKISLLSLLQLADAMACLDSFSNLFPVSPATRIENFVAPRRKRGTK